MQLISVITIKIRIKNVIKKTNLKQVNSKKTTLGKLAHLNARQSYIARKNQVSFTAEKLVSNANSWNNKYQQLKKALDTEGHRIKP